MFVRLDDAFPFHSCSSTVCLFQFLFTVQRWNSTSSAWWKVPFHPYKGLPSKPSSTRISSCTGFARTGLVHRLTFALVFPCKKQFSSVTFSSIVTKLIVFLEFFTLLSPSVSGLSTSVSLFEEDRREKKTGMKERRQSKKWRR